MLFFSLNLPFVNLISRAPVIDYKNVEKKFYFLPYKYKFWFSRSDLEPGSILLSDSQVILMPLVPGPYFE